MSDGFEEINGQIPRSYDDKRSREREMARLSKLGELDMVVGPDGHVHQRKDSDMPSFLKDRVRGTKSSYCPENGEV